MTRVVVLWMLWLGFAASSVFFALAETALFSLGKWQVRQLALRHPLRGELVQKLLSVPHDLLATIVLGNTFSNAFMVGLIVWLTPHNDWTIYLVMAALFALILLGCEVAPKTLAVRDPVRWALLVAPTVQWLLRGSRPFRRIAQGLNDLIVAIAARRAIKPHTGVTEEEYQELVEMAFQQGSLGASEKEIILQIIALDRKTAHDVMRPRSQMACIADDLSVEGMIAAARKYRHKRLPIYDETPDTIVGILNTQALLLNPGVDLAEVIEFPSCVPGSMNLLQLFKSLQKQQRGLAIVLDEFGGTAGVVSMEDILEEVVGEIRGEVEPQGFVMEKLGEGRWRVNGTMRLDDFRREYPALNDYPGVDTLGGLVCALAEVVPGEGEIFQHHGLRLKVLVADERRVRELLVETIGRTPKGTAA
ncbi:MAG: hemolysin family protein [Verrucomicrobiota bacterium]